VASSKGGTYVLLATNVRDTFYLDENLPSLSRCYRIEAVDRSNNVSELSDPVCNSNCPYYELPNIFSPNNDGCNDLFRAYGDPLLGSGETPSDCQKFDTEDTKCARFILRVEFTVYNRWGTKVYSYTGQQGDENTIYIRWNGQDDKGKELASAIYYYIAELTVDVVDPAKRKQIKKGWVHLIR
jgi:hypothetical protein